MKNANADPQKFNAVTYRTDTEIYLLCWKTRDQVVIRKGDRAW